MPSTLFLKGVTVPALPVIEQDGLIWAWAGDSTPAAQLPRFQPPEGFRVVAEVTLEVEADWGEVCFASAADLETSHPAIALALAQQRCHPSSSSARPRSVGGFGVRHGRAPASERNHAWGCERLT